MSSDSALLTVDLDALAANYALLVKEARGAEVAPVVKADGYGLGAADVSKRLRSEGARSFFVARVAEGEALRAVLGPEPAIYVLDGVPPGTAARLQDAGLVPVLNSVAQLEEWTARARGGTRLPAALHIDTGMNRLGLRPEEAEALAEAPSRLNGVDVEMVVSHLACGDETGQPLNARQLAAFRAARRLFPEARASLANSAGTFLGEDYLFEVTRPGISLYGGGPRALTDARIRPVATYEAPILQVRTVPPGETIGYGATHTADAPLRIAVLAAGYADGVLRASGPSAYAFLDGGRRRYLGRISMDLIAVDVTEAPDARPGRMVQLIGRDVPLDEAAGWAGTLAYELLVRLGQRARRRYLG